MEGPQTKEDFIVELSSEIATTAYNISANGDYRDFHSYLQPILETLYRRQSLRSIKGWYKEVTEGKD